MPLVPVEVEEGGRTDRRQRQEVGEEGGRGGRGRRGRRQRQRQEAAAEARQAGGRGRQISDLEASWGYIVRICLKICLQPHIQWILSFSTLDSELTRLLSFIT